MIFFHASVDTVCQADNAKDYVVRKVTRHSSLLRGHRVRVDEILVLEANGTRIKVHLKPRVVSSESAPSYREGDHIRLRQDVKGAVNNSDIFVVTA